MRVTDEIPAEKAVEVHGLHVRYGRKLAVRDVSFTVGQGLVYALLGRNGAGKSSLVRCLLGLQKADSGRSRILGNDSWRERKSLMAQVGVMTETPNAPPRISSRRTFRFLARLHPGADEKLFDERLERFGVDADQPFGKLSRGQKTVVSLAFALVGSPKILVLDDPTLGLDAVARRAFFDELIGDLADRKTTVVLCSHDLAGVEGIANRIGVLSEGRLVLDEDLDRVKGRFRRLRFAAGSQTAAEEILTRIGLQSQRQEAWGNEVVIDSFAPEKTDDLRSALGADLEIEPLSLEEVFLALSGSGLDSRETDR